MNALEAKLMPKRIAFLTLIWVLLGLAACDDVNGKSDRQLQFTFFSMDQRPLEDCFKDSKCDIFTFSVDLHRPNALVNNPKQIANNDLPSLISYIDIRSPDKKLTRRAKLIAINAQSPEDCVNEKECVWYAFRNAVLPPGPISDQSKIVRWEESIVFDIITDKKNETLKESSASFFSNTSPLLPFKISHGKNPNFLIISLSLLDTTWMVDSKIKTFLEYNKIKINYDALLRNKEQIDRAMGKAPCFPVFSEITETQRAAIILVKKDSGALCTASLMRGLGLQPILKDFPFSILGTGPYPWKEATKLDLFLIHLLYQREFRSGTKGRELRSIFDSIYSRSLESFELEQTHV